ncbi:hypothetical protein Sps_02997 [Shewanella psychrophila]|uniref:Uncharacterized protein n=1 Tax=Shewanella psychrophila TaxID=225848 RepID=A0A1S6HRN0_9GAMM|nr:hypothetical protein [Shewanella psychrophila]AQS38144.1 hypothetical protein Sps_02997 [Shewanella psychrophila]
MTKSALISITLVAVAVVAAIGYQSFSSEPGSVGATSPQDVTTSTDTQQGGTSAKPVAPVSMSAPKAVTQTSMATQSAPEKNIASEATDFAASPDAKPSAVNDPSHPPRQAPNANRAPRSAPNSASEYAHHPRPGTEQPVSAPVSMPSQAPVK